MAKAKRKAKKSKQRSQRSSRATPKKRSLSTLKHEFTRGLDGWITHTDLASNEPSRTKTFCIDVLGWKFREPMTTPNGGSIDAPCLNTPRELLP